MSRPVTNVEGFRKRLIRDGFDPESVTLSEVKNRSIDNWSQTGVFSQGRLVGVYGQRRDGRIQSAISYASDLDRWSVPLERNPRIGPLMEGFAELLQGRAKVDMTLGNLSVELAYRDEDGDLTLDILRMKSGRSYAAAAAGELGRLPSAGVVFVEHNTYVKPAFRGKGLMLELYKDLLLAGDASIISDQWNHSEPMRRVWMKLSKVSGVHVFSTVGDGLVDAAGKPFEWSGFDGVLIAVSADNIQGAEERASHVLSELGTDWSAYAVEDHDRFADDGKSDWF